MGQLKEVWQKQWEEGRGLALAGREGGREISAIYREKRLALLFLLLLLLRPSGLLEPNKCGRKKSVRTESVTRFRSCNNSSLRDVLGSTEARGEREERLWRHKK